MPQTGVRNGRDAFRPLNPPPGPHKFPRQASGVARIQTSSSLAQKRGQAGSLLLHLLSNFPRCAGEYVFPYCLVDFGSKSSAWAGELQLPAVKLVETICSFVPQKMVAKVLSNSQLQSALCADTETKGTYEPNFNPQAPHSHLLGIFLFDSRKGPRNTPDGSMGVPKRASQAYPPWPGV